MIPTRGVAVKFIHDQLKRPCSDELWGRKEGKIHYGIQELKDLIDFIYGNEYTKSEELKGCKD